MNSEVWLGMFALLGSAWASYISFLGAKLKAGQDDNNKILNELKHMSEGRYLSQLKLTMDALSKVAALTGLPEDISAADIAKKAFLHRAILQQNMRPEGEEPQS